LRKEVEEEHERVLYRGKTRERNWPGGVRMVEIPLLAKWSGGNSEARTERSARYDKVTYAEAKTLRMLFLNRQGKYKRPKLT